MNDKMPLIDTDSDKKPISPCTILLSCQANALTAPPPPFLFLPFSVSPSCFLEGRGARWCVLGLDSLTMFHYSSSGPGPTVPEVFWARANQRQGFCRVNQSQTTAQPRDPEVLIVHISPLVIRTKLYFTGLH